VIDERAFGGVRPLRGTVRVPGDKSISHRALLFAGLATGTSTITHLATGHDVRATGAALEAVGVQVAWGDTVTVESPGIDWWTEPADVIDCGNSGTSMRVLSGALAGREFLSVLTGDASLRRRPMARVTRPLRDMGARIDGRDHASLAPLVIHGRRLTAKHFDLEVASAQVKSALIVAGLQAEGETVVVSPAPTRDHTERMLAALGATVHVEGLVVRVRSGAPRPIAIDVPGDPSSAAFFAVAAAITPGSEVEVVDVSCNPSRTGFVTVMKRMGADIELTPTGEVCGEPVGRLRVRASRLHGTTIAGDEIPNVQDEIPVLAVAAAFADGVTEVRDAAELIVKESNRIATVQAELQSLGAGVEALPDGLVIRGGSAPTSARFESHGDHRVAMAMAVAANAVDGASTVRGWDVVATSYPEFADDLARLTGDA
jgi:3-phosphoshikimate 1-carboxyvinyltransferase